MVEEVPQTQALEFMNAVENSGPGPQIVTNSQGQIGEVINIDQSLLQGANVLPLSVTVDSFGNLTENNMTTQVLQGFDGMQLQLGGGNIAQGIQITGLDPSVFNQAVQIDANLLQQLQAGNVNISLNQLQGTDPSLIQVQPISIQDSINPNLVVQPLNTLDPASQNGLQQQISIGQESTTNNFTASGSVNEQQVCSIQLNLC